MKKSVFVVVGILMILIVFGSFASALTASIGNAKMIVRANPGDEVRKSILVKNTNDVAVEISLESVGDIADWIDLDDETFILNPGAERKAWFTIDAKSSGSYEGRIQVGFSSTEEDSKGGVGLSSVILLRVSGDEDNTDNTDYTDGDEDTATNSSVNIGGTGTGNVISNSNSEISAGTVLAVSSLILMIVLVVVLVFLAKKKSKINKKRGKEKA